MSPRALKWFVILACLGPVGWMVWGAFGGGDLGPDPVKGLQVATGLSAIVLLLLSLVITPLRRHLQWNWSQPLRRVFGLAAFGYVLLHAVIYFVFDQGLDLGSIWADTVEHPRIAVGFISFLMLIPLALTSTDAAIRRLGKRWSRLHRLAYVATALGLIHYLMVQKLDVRDALPYLGIFTVLMLFRLAGRRTAPVR